MKMVKPKIREISIRKESGSFSLFSAEKKTSKSEYDFDGLDSFRKLLSKEKARMLDAIKYKKPTSIYNLAKILQRPFKAVVDDVKILERFGFIELVKETKNNRIRHVPVIISDQIMVHIKI